VKIRRDLLFPPYRLLACPAFWTKIPFVWIIYPDRLQIIYSEMFRKAYCTISFVRLEHVQSASRFGNYNPDIIMVFRIIISEHPVFEVSGKNSRFFSENEIRTARLYILLQNLAEADHLYHKQSLHL